MALITYDDKVAINENSQIAEKNKVSASDMNQLKDVINENANNFDELSNDFNNFSNDTGWISISSYLDTSNFAERKQYPLKLRKIGNIVYLTGEFYKINNVGSASYAFKALNALPQEYRPAQGFQFSSGGKQFSLNNPYTIWIQDDGCIYINPTNFNPTEDFQGFSLSNIGCYPTN